MNYLNLNTLINQQDMLAPVPTLGQPGYFSTKRKYDIHTGVDIYLKELAPVFALEDGIVVDIENFTGESAGSGWWNETKAIVVKSLQSNHTIVYGELIPNESLKIGSTVSKGELLGRVISVLKIDKGVTPTSMLHLELYDSSVFSGTVWWKNNESRPDGLMDPMLLLSHAFDSIEFKMISAYYADRKAKRSGVPLMNHIKEGISILVAIGASKDAQLAYCLHPIVQGDYDLMANYRILENTEQVSKSSIIRAMEYRNIANQYLSHRVIENIDQIQLSPMKDINDMLIADKIQNYKDFILYHKGTHPRSKELDEYFNNWLLRLNIKNFHEWFEYLAGRSLEEIIR